MEEWSFIQLYCLFSIPTRLHNIGIITSSIDKSVTDSDAGTFCHPVLLDTEHVEGFKLGIDSWADTLCAGKHEFVEEFIESKYATATKFTSSLGSVSIFPLQIFLTYDAIDVTFLLLKCNNSIYLGQKMFDSLLNPIQEEELRIRVYT